MSNFSKWMTLVVALLVSTVTVAQNAVIKSASIDRMLDVYAAKNKSQETVRAWNIQIGAYNDRREMETEKSRFENVFPYLRLAWSYDNPYYILKMRDAAYKEKLDALNMLHRIKRRYPSAILILDDVKPKDIFNSGNF